jgi:hypothetical protein
VSSAQLDTQARSAGQRRRKSQTSAPAGKCRRRWQSHAKARARMSSVTRSSIVTMPVITGGEARMRGVRRSDTGVLPSTPRLVLLIDPFLRQTIGEVRLDCAPPFAQAVDLSCEEKPGLGTSRSRCWSLNPMVVSWRFRTSRSNPSILVAGAVVPRGRLRLRCLFGRSTAGRRCTPRLRTRHSPEHEHARRDADAEEPLKRVCTPPRLPPPVTVVRAPQRGGGLRGSVRHGAVRPRASRAVLDVHAIRDGNGDRHRAGLNPP